MRVDSKNILTLSIPEQLTGDSSSEFTAKLTNILETKPCAIYLDCSKLDFVTPAHIFMIWDARRSCSEAGTEAVLTSLSTGLERALETLSLGDLVSGDVSTVRSISSESKSSEKSTIIASYKDKLGIANSDFEKGQQRFLDFIGQLRLPEATEFELRTVFYEVVTNIRTHAGISDDSLIEFSAQADRDGIRLEFIDSGMPFDWNDNSLEIDFQEAAKRRQHRGFGVTIIRRLTDRISCIRTDDARNVLTIEKTWRQ